jgi:hypothetical protein
VYITSTLNQHTLQFNHIELKTVGQKERRVGTAQDSCIFINSPSIRAVLSLSLAFTFLSIGKY